MNTILFGVFLLLGATVSGFKRVQHSRVTGRLVSQVQMSSADLNVFLETQVASAKDLRISVDNTVAKAKGNVKRGEVLYSLPIGNCFDRTTALSVLSDANPKFKSTQLRTGDLGLLALYLLHEKKLGTDSKFAPYIDVLPQECPGILSWSDEQIVELIQSTTRDVGRQLAAVKEDYRTISAILALPDSKGLEISMEEFKWALGTVKDKHIYVENEVLLVPGIDFMPHDPVSAAEPVMGSAGMWGGKIVKAISDRDYTSGDTVFTSFGLKNSAECVEDHGFVPVIPIGDSSCEFVVRVNGEFESEWDKYWEDKVVSMESAGE